MAIVRARNACFREPTMKDVSFSPEKMPGARRCGAGYVRIFNPGARL
jgi:hypothetical protein